MTINIRKAQDNDAELIISYFKKLAEYEKLGDYCKITKDALLKLLNEPNGLSAVIAEINGTPVGFMAYYFYKIATFSGKRVLYIEDVYIDEEYRRCGIGNMLFEFAKQTASEQNCARLEWKCLEWNESAKSFYKKIGGNCAKDEWLTYTIDV